MGGFSLIHWLILGVVILLLFGGNRFSSMMGDVAKGLKSFKQGMADDEANRPQDPRMVPPQTPTPFQNPQAPYGQQQQQPYGQQHDQQQFTGPRPSPTIDLTPHVTPAESGVPHVAPPADEQTR
jgi:sec-independent protein translocase protein TatA